MLVHERAVLWRYGTMLWLERSDCAWLWEASGRYATILPIVQSAVVTSTLQSSAYVALRRPRQ